MLEINRIYNQSCLDTMARMEDNCVDLTLTSPPYNMNLRITKGKNGLYKYCSRQIVKELSTKYSGFDDNMPIEEFYQLHSSILKELVRVSKITFYNFAIVTGSKRAFFKMIGDFSDSIKDVIIWDKVHGQPAMANNVLNRRCEILLVLEKPELAVSRQFSVCNFKRGTTDDIWCIKRGKKISKDHGATFPEELAKNIICNFSNEGSLIYDPFMGTGTTAKIAMLNKRNYIGSEISKKYCKVAEKRLKS